jgi:hypothetical protein
MFLAHSQPQYFPEAPDFLVQLPFHGHMMAQRPNLTSTPLFANLSSLTIISWSNLVPTLALNSWFSTAHTNFRRPIMVNVSRDIIIWVIGVSWACPLLLYESSQAIQHTMPLVFLVNAPQRRSKRQLQCCHQHELWFCFIFQVGQSLL